MVEPQVVEPGIEAWELHDFRVLMLTDRFDEDSDQVWVTVRASGRYDAVNQAREQVPTGSWLRVEELP